MYKTARIEKLRHTHFKKIVFFLYRKLKSENSRLVKFIGFLPVMIMTLCVGFQSPVATAHSNSIGYKNQAAGVLRFYIGSDHGSASSYEGYLKLVAPDGTITYNGFTADIGAVATCTSSSGTIACPDSDLIAKTEANGGNFFVTNSAGAIGAYGDSSYSCRSYGGNPGISDRWQYVDISLDTPGSYSASYIACDDHPDNPTTSNCRGGSANAMWDNPTCFGTSMSMDITEADLGIPSLTGASLEPADDATGVSVLQKLKIVFSEAVNVGSGVIKVIKTSTSEVIESISVTSSQVTGGGTDTINATWNNALEGSTDYCVQIESTAFDSVSSGQGFAGISDQTTWNFQTRALPGISSTTPNDDATNVAVDSTLTFNFSEAMTVSSGSFTIFKSSDGSIFEMIDITSSQVTGSGTSTITIVPSDFFEANTSYHILLDAAALQDSTGDPHSGITDTTVWNFTTKEATPDPFIDDPVIVGIVEAQAELANRAVFGSLVPVTTRMMQFRRNRRSPNISSQGIEFKLANPEVSKAMSYAPIQALMQIEDGFLERLARGIINPQGQALGKDWAIWSVGTVIIGKTDATSNVSGSEFTTDGLTVGVDKKVDEKRLFGMSVRKDKEENDVGVGSYVNTDSEGLTLYGSWSKDDSSYVDAAIGFNELVMDIQRTTRRGQILKGERTGYQIFQTATLVKELSFGETTLSPYANISLGYTRFGSYDEIGDIPNQALSFGSQSITLKKGHLGLQFDKTVESRFGFVRPFGRLEYGKDMSTGSDITASYSVDPTTIFSTSWKNSRSTGWRLETGFDFEIKSGFIGFSYERIEEESTTSSDSTKVHADSVQIRLLYTF